MACRCWRPLPYRPTATSFVIPPSPLPPVRVALGFGLGSMFGSIFWKLGLQESSIQNRVSLFVNIAMNTAMFGCIRALQTLAVERRVVAMERMDQVFFFLERLSVREGRGEAKWPRRVLRTVAPYFGYRIQHTAYSSTVHRRETNSPSRRQNDPLFHHPEESTPNPPRPPPFPTPDPGNKIGTASTRDIAPARICPLRFWRSFRWTRCSPPYLAQREPSVAFRTQPCVQLFLEERRLYFSAITNGKSRGWHPLIISHLILEKKNTWVTP